MNKKKLLALLMALVMTFTLVPVTALAEGVDSTDAVAEVGGTYYSDLQEAIAVAMKSTEESNKTVNLLKNVSVDTWYQNVFATSHTGSGTEIEYAIRDGFNLNSTVNWPGSVTIDGHGYTLTVQNILSAGNGNSLFKYAENLTVRDLTVVAPDGISIRSGLIENVKFEMTGGAAIYTSESTGDGDDHVEIIGCTFNSPEGDYIAIYSNDNGQAKGVVIANNTFNTYRSVILRNDEQFLRNVVNGAKGVTVDTGATPRIEGNYFTILNTSRSIDIYPAPNAVITGNVILGNIELENLEYSTPQDLSGNYWGGSAPNTVAKTFSNSYYNTANFYDSRHDDGTLFALSNLVSTSTAVAKIGTTNYATLAEAFAAAQDGDTITLLADCSGNGISVPQGKFGTNGLTVNFAGFTYTVDQEPLAGSTGTKTQAFQLLKDNKITFKNGTIYSEVAKMLVQNYSNLTLDGMTLTLNNSNYAYAYTLSNNNGSVVIKDTTITANPAGGFAFDVCRYASYPSVSVTVQGNSVINGNIEFDAGNSNPIDGIHLTLTSGTHTGSISLTNGGKNALNAGVNASITKASTFTQAAPEGYTWSAADTNGIQTLVKLPPVAKIGNVEYATLREAITAAQTGDTINIIADFTIPETNTAESDRIIVNKSVTIDFGEYTMSVPGALGDKTSNNWVGLYIQGIDVNVTLTGTTGGIDCLNYNDGAGAYSFYAKDGATVTVNGGHYHGGGTVGQVAAGTLIINDGYFKVTDYSGEYSGYRYVLNCIDSYYKSGTAKIAVKGGTFENFDPSNCLAEGANTNFVADGYEAVALTGENEGKWQVGKVKATGLTLDTTAQNDNTTATYTATKSVVDEQTNANLLEKPETSFSVTVTAPTENLGSGKESIQLSNININEVVAAAVDKADEQSETNASVVVQLAKDESAQVVVTETTKKVTFEVHPEAIITVTKTDEDDVVTTLPLSNDQIKGAFSFKLTIPTDLATVGEKVTVIHKHSDNTEENLGAFTVADDHTITLTGISSFSEFIATSVSEGDVTVGAVGASLRRRVLTSDHTTVVNTSTDYRVTFDWTDTESKVNVSESYLEWSNNDGATWHKVSIANSAALDGGVTRASVVITGIPRAAFGTTIKTRIHLATSGEAIVAYGPDYSVNVVADKLSKLTGNETWSEYGRYLLGTRTEPLYVNN